MPAEAGGCRRGVASFSGRRQRASSRERRSFHRMVRRKEGCRARSHPAAVHTGEGVEGEEGGGMLARGGLPHIPNAMAVKQPCW